jgi:regulator of protease activity HflC (stomatin/prohibitin superfamily)
MEAEAQAQQQALLAQARADAATRLAEAMQANPQATEAIRLLLARDWMAMGEAMAQAPGGSVLMVDPQSPASLLTALKGLQGNKS